MTKLEFLEKLNSRLQALPEGELQDTLSYYDEMIDDKTESGLSEEEAVFELGSPEDVARETLLNLPLPTLIKQKCKRKNPWKGWEIALLCIGAPVWLPLALAAIALAFVAYALIWVGVAVLWAVEVALAIASLVSLFATFPLLFSSPPNALFNFGLAFLCAGVCTIGAFGCLKLSKLTYELNIYLLKKIKSTIIRRDSHHE